MKWKESGTNEEVHQLSVEAEWSELSVDYDELLSEYRKLSLPGFRAGKAPLALIEKRFAKEIFEDLSQRAAQRFGREAIRETDTEVWGPAEIENITCKKGEVFRAELRFIPLPEIELPDFQYLENKDRDQISITLLEQMQLDVPARLVVDELEVDGLEASAPDGAEWSAAADRLKLMLILKQIAKRDGIEIDERDVEARIAEKAKEFHTTEKKLRAELNTRGGAGLQRLRDMLLAESTFDYLTEIKISE
ncbi:MAG: hypothetical protein KAG97_13485 [Victivallales bacterium]|nr:hypothetical protein [Victivallales bacterium]